MRHLDEGTIHAWLDGGLSSDEARATEAHVAGCVECAAAVAEARGLVAASSRILTALDAVPGGVRPAAPAQPVHRTPAGQRSMARVLRLQWARGSSLGGRSAAAAVAFLLAGGAVTVALRSDWLRQGDDWRSVAPLVVTADDRQGIPVFTTPAGTPAAPQVASADRRPGRGAATPGAGAAANVAARTAPTNMELAAADKPTVADSQRAEVAPEPVVGQRTDQSAALQLAEAEVRQQRREESAERQAFAAAPVAGVTAGAAAPPPAAMAERPKLVDSTVVVDDGRIVRRATYVLDEGTTVTLDAYDPLRAVRLRSPDRRMSAVGGRAPATSAAEAKDAATPVPSRLRWTDARGIEYTLSGPVPPARLEAIRRALGLD